MSYSGSEIWLILRLGYRIFKKLERTMRNLILLAPYKRDTRLRD